MLRELPHHELTSALDAACAGDTELRAQVMGLIEADRNLSSTDFLGGHAVEDAAKLLVPAIPAPGTVIGNYRLRSPIGSGGMGVVFEAEDLRLHRRVALKFLLLDLAAEAHERVQREAHAAVLTHPNLISIYDAGFDLGRCYIAMELVEGKTLRELLPTGKHSMDARKILDLIGQAVAALSAVHEAGIVHRDIKPENIMVRSDGFVKVLDFGLAKLREGESGSTGCSDFRTRDGNLAGTIRYFSPEQILGERAGPRSDIFSLGVVAYELATGVHPFNGPTDKAAVDAILNHVPPVPSSIRPSLGSERYDCRDVGRGRE